MTHGLTARTLILPSEEEPEYQRRLAAWRSDLAPCNPYEEDLVREAASLSWRLDRADRVQAALLADWMANGPAEESRRRREEVEDLGSRLWPGSFPTDPVDPPGERTAVRLRMWPAGPDDPDDPARLVHRVERTPEGCRWLLDRWAGLRAAIDAGIAWSPAEMLGAIRLLGQWPLAAADDRRVLGLILDVAAMDGDRPDPFAALWEGLALREVESYRERLRGRGIDSPIGRSRDEARERLLALTDEAVEELRAREAMLREREAVGRAGGLLFDDSREAEWLRRQQIKATRGVLRIVERFRAARRRGEALSPNPPTKRPIDHPMPRPGASIDLQGPGEMGRQTLDVPARLAADPGSGITPPRHPGEAGRTAETGRWSGQARRDPCEPDPQQRRPGARTAPSDGGTDRRLRLLGALALLLPFITAARPTEGSSPSDRSATSARAGDPAALPAASRDHRPPDLPGLDSRPTALDPRKRQNEPIVPPSRPRNRQNEPIFDPVARLLRVGAPPIARSADRSRGPPGCSDARSWPDRPSSAPGSSWPCAPGRHGPTDSAGARMSRPRAVSLE